MLAAVFAVVFVEAVRPGLPIGWTSSSEWSIAAQVIFLASLVNVGLCVFNMIPIPPLDGSVLFERLLPARYWPTYLKYRRYTMPVLMGLVLLNFFLIQHGHGTDHVALRTASTAGGRRRLTRASRRQLGRSNPMASAARA